MPPILLTDGNSLGHVLRYIDRPAGRYGSAGLLARLDGIVRYLEAQGQKTEIVLFLALDDLYRLAKTRRCKIGATINKHGERPGIVAA